MAKHRLSPPLAGIRPLGRREYTPICVQSSPPKRFFSARRDWRKTGRASCLPAGSPRRTQRWAAAWPAPIAKAREGAHPAEGRRGGKRAMAGAIAGDEASWHAYESRSRCADEARTLRRCASLRCTRRRSGRGGHRQATPPPSNRTRNGCSFMRRASNGTQ
jgi:hypothetical protein